MLNIFFLRFAFLLLIVCCTLTFSTLSQGIDMFAWFKKQVVVLSTEVNGVVTENGKPVANLEVIRKLIDTDEIANRELIVS
jgi:hypothetical protein